LQSGYTGDASQLDPRDFLHDVEDLIPLCLGLDVDAAKARRCTELRDEVPADKSARGGDQMMADSWTN